MKFSSLVLRPELNFFDEAQLINWCTKADWNKLYECFLKYFFVLLQSGPLTYFIPYGKNRETSADNLHENICYGS